MPLSAQSLAPAEIDIRVDRATSRLFVTIAGAATGLQVANALARCYLADPEVVRWDMLFDLRTYQGAVEADHVKIIVDAYERCDPDSKVPCRTAFVTPDKNFRLWAAAMSFQFKGREHQAFPTFEEAERFLGEPMAERHPFEAVDPS
jgi:hypothetical protein